MRSIQAKLFIRIAALHGVLAVALQLILDAWQSQATVWPSAGIALGLLLVYGGRYWPAIALGSFACYVAHGEWGIGTAALVGGVTGLAAWLGAWAIHRLGRIQLSLPSVLDMALLAVGGIAVAPLSSAIGSAFVLAATGAVTTAAAVTGAVNWWFAEALGALACAPLVVAWHSVREQVQRTAAEWIAFGASVLAVVTCLLFVHVGYTSAYALLALSVVPLLVWSANRFGMRITTTLNAALALSTAVGFATGEGLFGYSVAGGGGPWAPQLFTAFTIVLGLVFASSVRDRTQVVEQLLASERRLTTIFDGTPDHLALLQIGDGRVLSLEAANRAFLDTLRQMVPGLKAEDTVGRPATDVTAMVSDTLHEYQPARAGILQAMTTGQTTNIAQQLHLPSGELSIEATAVPVRNDAGTMTHILWHSRDVTARVQAERALRASEARWRSLIEATPQSIFLLDKDASILFVNRAPNGRPSETMLGKPILEFVLDDASRDTARDGLRDVIERGVTHTFDIEASGPERGRAWYRCHAGPVWDQGRVVATILVAADITESKRAEVAKHQLELQLYQSQKMEALGTLAGGIAHDFNNVLAGIMANAELLRDVVAADQDASDSVRDILAAGRRARDVVRQILAFSRRQPLQRRSVKLSDVIVEAMTLLRASLSSAIRLRTTVRAEEVRVFADETQLHQVVMNLATNAAQAIGNQDGEIVFDARIVEVDGNGTRAGAAGRPALEPGAYARLTVRDNGPGMDRATLDRIFDPFFTTKPIGQGTGLGLAVVHGIVTSHNGAIVAESDVGKGASFSIYLPLYREAEEGIGASAMAGGVSA